MVLEARLDKLREWGAASARTDASRILRHADLLARNWRYTATPVGRQVQRFYRKVLAGTPTVREIPLSSLARVVEAAEALVAAPEMGADTAELVGRLYVNHDDLDSALVGAEDNLAALVDPFDSDQRWDYVGEAGELMFSKRFRMRFFLPQELDALLYAHGLAVVEKYGTFDGTPFASESPKQIVVAEPRRHA